MPEHEGEGTSWHTRAFESSPGGGLFATRVVEDHLAADEDEGRAAGTGGARPLTSRRQNCVERAIRLGLPLWGQLPGEHHPGDPPPGIASLTKRSGTAGKTHKLDSTVDSTVLTF
jgi:hypothetical protein